MKLIRKNEQLFAVNEGGQFIGEIVNNLNGGCIENPPEVGTGTFARVFEGHGYIYHQHDNPPNPFFNASWSEVFENPELLPVGTRHVFVDQGRDAEDSFNAVLV